MDSIHITAILKPKKGFEEQLLPILKELQTASRQEEGCIKYDLHQSMEDHTVVIQEAWENNGAIERHVQTAHYQEYREKTADTLSTREVYKLKAI